MNSFSSETDLCLRKCNGAFTLVEVLVSSAILAILLGLMFTVINNASTIASTTSSQLEVSRIGREALDLIGRDLSSVATPWSRSSALPYSKSSSVSLQFVVNPPNVPTQFANRDVMFWQTPIARNVSKGNLAIVGYYVQRDFQSSSPDKSRFQLRRAFVEPVDTADYLIYSNPADWITPTLYSTFAPATGALDYQNAQKGWVADGILGLWIRCYDKFGNNIPYATNSTFNSREGYKIAAIPSPSPAVQNPSFPANYSALPAFVEISLVCISPREIILLRTAPPAAPVTTTAGLETTIAAYITQIKNANPAVKTIGSVSRKYRILNSD